MALGGGDHANELLDAGRTLGALRSELPQDSPHSSSLPFVVGSRAAVANGSIRAVFQATVAPEDRGRVFILVASVGRP